MAANPASVYVIEKGAELQIIKLGDGGEIGIARWPDDPITWEEWSYTRKYKWNDSYPKLGLVLLHKSRKTGRYKLYRRRWFWFYIQKHFDWGEWCWMDNLGDNLLPKYYRKK